MKLLLHVPLQLELQLGCQYVKAIEYNRKADCTYLTILCKSAPENPDVPRARTLGSTSTRNYRIRLAQIKVKKKLFTATCGNVFHMMLQNLDTPTNVRQRYGNMSIEPTRSD